MKKFRFSREFRARFSEKLMDLGNLAGAALIFGQFINGNEFSLTQLFIGLVLITVCYIISYLITN